MAKNIVRRTEIRVGDRVADAYTMDEPSPTGGFINYLSGSGMAKVICLPRNTTLQNRLSQDLKAALPGDFTTLQASFKNEAGGRSKLNLWTTDYASIFFNYHSIQGNIQAQAIMYALAATSLDIIANDAFNREYERGTAERAAALKLERLFARNSWTDVMKERMERAGYYSDRQRVLAEFKDLTIQVNVALFGQRHFCCDRDTMTLEQQMTINDFERLARRIASKFSSATPMEIVEKTLTIF